MAHQRVRPCLALAVAGLGLLIGHGVTALGVPASPVSFPLEQPFGLRFQAHQWGDEWQHGVETADGYTILKDNQNRWVYAQRNVAGELVPSDRVVGRDAPGNIPKHLRPAGDVQAFGAPGHLAEGQQQAPPTSGTHRLLVIFVDFTPSSNVGTTEADLERHFFSGGGTYTPDSTKDYWDTVSYGAITLSPAQESYGTANNGVVMVTLGTANPLCEGTADPDNCERQLTRDAILAADPDVTFSTFDDNGDGFLNTNELHLYVVAAGYEGSFGNQCGNTASTWGHNWSLGFSWNGTLVDAPTVDGTIVAHWRGAPTAGPYKGGYNQEGEWFCHDSGTGPHSHPSTIGVSAHELGHDMGTGAPDLYDTCSTCGTDSFGIGDWGLQGGGSWNFAPTQSHSGMSPAFPDPWSRWFFGFISPTAITGDTLDVSLPQIETATGTNRGVYFLPNMSVTHWDDCTGGVGEYFLVENRQRVGFDAGLPGEGVMIWHIFEELDTCRPNGDEGTSPPGNPRLVVVEQADGDFGLECYSGSPGDPTCNSGDGTDPWYSGNAATFDNATTPNSKFYSGSASGTCVTNISTSGDTMTADMGVSGCPAAGPAPLFRVERQTGDVFAAGTFNPGGADLAERIDTSEPVEPGDVVAIDPANPKHYRKARQPYSRLAAGVIAAKPGFTLANRPAEMLSTPARSHSNSSSPWFSAGILHYLLRATATAIGRATLDALQRPIPAMRTSIAQLIKYRKALHQGGRPLLALMGQVLVKATTENGSIRPGDLLVSSSTPGYVMRCADPQRCEGGIVGKALEPLTEGTALILMLVTK